jgi:hypothetical protein
MFRSILILLAVSSAFITACAKDPVQPVAQGPVNTEFVWTPDSYGTYHRAIHGSAADNIYTVAPGDRLYHFNGSSWTTTKGIGTPQDLLDVWVAPNGTPYAVGSAGIAHYYSPVNGGSWLQMWSPVTAHMWGIWGSASNSIFYVGNSGTAVFYNGSNSIVLSTGNGNSLNDVWGTSATNVYAVGMNGTILHYNGTGWTAETSNTTQRLDGVWGNAANSVFVVGGAGTILRFNGSSWQPMESNTTVNLYKVWGTSGSDVMAIGPNGTAMHYNGASWALKDTGTTEGLQDIWGARGEYFVVSGGSGLFLQAAPE